VYSPLACMECINLIFMFPCIMIQYTKRTNKMQLCRIIYYSLGCSTCFKRYFRSSSGASKLYYSFWYYTRMSLPAGIMGVLAMPRFSPYRAVNTLCLSYKSQEVNA
jgi:hypothetical protein